MAVADLKMSSRPITSWYGPRILNGRANFHKGVDFSYPLGMAVAAWGDGSVTHVGWSPPGSSDRERGIWVEVTHAPGIKTSYHSLKSTAVIVGQAVKMGQMVGAAGMSATGATGSHLHAGLWINGSHVDPLKYLTQGEIRTVSTGSTSGGGSTPFPPSGDDDMTPDQAKALSNIESNLSWVVNAIQDPIRGLAARVAKIEELQNSAGGNIRYLVNASQTPETGIEARLAKIQSDIQGLAASGGDLDDIEEVIVAALKSVSYRAI